MGSQRMMRLMVPLAPEAREDSPRPNPILGILTPSFRVTVGVDILYLVVERNLKEEDSLGRLFSLEGKWIYNKGQRKCRIWKYGKLYKELLGARVIRSVPVQESYISQ